MHVPQSLRIFITQSKGGFPLRVEVFKFRSGFPDSCLASRSFESELTLVMEEAAGNDTNLDCLFLVSFPFVFPDRDQPLRGTKGEGEVSVGRACHVSLCELVT